MTPILQPPHLLNPCNSHPLWPLVSCNPQLVTPSSSQDEKYDHLTEEEVKKLSEKDLEFQGVFHDVCNKASSQVLHEDPNVTVAQINTRRKVIIL